MQLSTRGRYAVMAMVDLAARERTPPQTPCCQQAAPVALAEIAAAQGLSLAYLEQLFAKLRRAGLVAALRGPGGGYRLARPASAISVAAVVGAVNERIKATRCTEKGVGCIAPAILGGPARRCRTHDLWAALGGEIERFLSEISLEDVLAGRIVAAAPPSPGKRPTRKPAAPATTAAAE